MQMLGHDGPPTNFWSNNLVTKAPMARCPLRSIQLSRESDPSLNAEIDRAIDVLFPAYVDGHLLVAGGIADQPHRYMQMMAAIKNMNADTEFEFRAIQTQNGEA